MENIQVSVRIKPKQLEEEKTSNPQWKVEGKSIVNMKSKDIFSYDRVFTPECQNADIFNESVKDNLSQIFKGINVSIFAYGQTCTGKTYTMRGVDYSPGIIPQALNYIFMKISEMQAESQDEEYSKMNLKVNEMKVAYLEIYNESVNDLLDTSKKNLEIREGKKGIFVENLTEIRVDTPDIAFNLVKQGDSNKIIAETKLNDKSSRSHCIFRISLELVDFSGKKYSSTLNLIDLAGSENATKTKTEGVRFQEGSNINKSLLALSNVIQKLSQANLNSNGVSKVGNGFINYRDSKLTRFLQPSLAGNSKTIIICTISVGNNNYSETLNTLLFAARAKNIKTTVKVNELIDEKDKMIVENSELKSRIKKLEERLFTSAKKQTTNKKNAYSNNPLNTINTVKNSCVQNLTSVPEFNMNMNQSEDAFSALNINSMSTMSTVSAMEKEVNLMKTLLLRQSNQKDFKDDFQRPFSIHQSSKKPFGASNENEIPNYPSINSGNYSTAEKLFGNKYSNPSITPSKNILNLNSNSNINSSNVNGTIMNPWSNSNSKAENLFNNNVANSFASPYINKYTNIYSSNNKLALANSSSNMNPYLNYSSTKSLGVNIENEIEQEIIELRHHNKELKQHFMEALEKKSLQIKSITETSDKLRRDLEENYLKIRLENERIKEELNVKETDLREILSKLNSSEKQLIYLREEMKLLKEKENLYNSCNNNNNKEGFKKEVDIVNEKVKLLENELLTQKKAYEILEKENSILNEKNFKLNKHNESLLSENFNLKTQTEMNNKNVETLKFDNHQLKSNIESYKSEISQLQSKLLLRKSEINQLKHENEKIIKKNFNSDYESKLKFLDGANKDLREEITKRQNNIEANMKTIKELESDNKRIKELLNEKEEEVKRLQVKNSVETSNSISYVISNADNFTVCNLTKDKDKDKDSCSYVFLQGEAEESHTMVLTLKEDLQSNGNKFSKSKKNSKLVVDDKYLLQNTITQSKDNKFKRRKEKNDKTDNDSSEAETASFCILDKNSCSEKSNESAIDNLHEAKLMNKKRGRKKKDLCCGC